MEESVFAVLYLSRAEIRFRAPEIRELAQQAAEKNERLAVSGYLCFKNGLFVQYLEGNKAVILNLLHKIRNDHRHHIISEVILGEYPERYFLGWDMRYLEQEELNHVHLEEVLDWIIEELEQEKVVKHAALKPIREMVYTIQKLRKHHIIA
jgi:hypothetical protein